MISEALEIIKEVEASRYAGWGGSNKKPRKKRKTGQRNYTI